MSASTESGDSAESHARGEPTGTTTQRTIGHDEFDPLGTLALILLYFLVLVVMWVFTYFVEFLGNDPTPMVLVV